MTCADVQPSSLGPQGLTLVVVEEAGFADSGLADPPQALNVTHTNATTTEVPRTHA
jgi:hypothetical protein